MEKIGQGCSRKAYLREDGKVVKKPRYKAGSNNAGAPDETILEELINRFKDEKSIKKIVQMREKGYDLPYPCQGILAEYLISLLIKDQNTADSFALCEEIKVRKRNNLEEIGIIGVYENAHSKPTQGRCSYKQIPLDEGLMLRIEDLHWGNFVNGIIVDYASVQY